MAEAQVFFKRCGKGVPPQHGKFAKHLTGMVSHMTKTAILDVSVTTCFCRLKR